MTMRIDYRAMTIDDLDECARLSHASGWNQTPRDWRMFLDLDPHCGCVALRDGRIVGTATTVGYRDGDEDRCGWVAMVLVEQSARGCGIGTQVTRAALELLQRFRAIKLDATPLGYPIYRKLGFVAEYVLSRMELAAGGAAANEFVAARPMTRDDLPAVTAFDRAVFGADRSPVPAWMFAGAPESAWLVEDDGGVAGYAFGRRGHRYDHLGPLMARDEATARRLALTCLSCRSGRAVIIDAPHLHPQWLQWLVSIGFREQRPLTRMYLGENSWPGLPEKQFGILGPDFG